VHELPRRTNETPGRIVSQPNRIVGVHEMQTCRTLRRRFLTNFYWAVREFPRRTWRCWKLVRKYYNTSDADWSSIAVVLQHQIRQVREHIDEHNIIAHADRYVREMRIAEYCLKRMTEDHAAIDNADKRFPGRGRHWANRIVELEKQDVEILCRELRRHLRNWWD